MTEYATTDDGEDDTPRDREDGRNFEATSTTRTPFFVACNAARYHRQDLIRTIQEQSGFRLICYVADIQCSIVRDDVIQFRDLLHNVDSGENIELLLHTPGGDIDAAEMLISMIRDRVGDAGFRIVVPHFAKSAGTLMVLGADTVVMSDTSELGPIDPQVLMPDSTGLSRWRPAQSYLDAFDEHSQRLREDPNDIAARIMCEKIDPALRQVCMGVKERARTLAEKLLKQGMFLDGTGNWTAVATELIDTNRWRTHSQAISWHDAMSDPISLRVHYLASDDGLWQQYWKLYCLQRLAIKDGEKLFESDYASLPTAC